MNLLYSLGILITSFILRIVAVFNNKIKLGVKGRDQTFAILEANIKSEDKTLWFHCASLGEYEQGLPVFTQLRSQYPNHKIVLSFFSPSGYQIRKNAPFADVVIYLPLDTKANAKRLLDSLKPELTIFVKYEIWPNILNELKRRELKAILISAVFRKNQTFFKWYGKNTRSALFAFQHIFTQNENSSKLLQSIGYNSVTVSGDTRYDRVSNQLLQDNTLDFISKFKNNNLCVVIGSSWPEDEKLISNYINSHRLKTTKFIIAPHNIKPVQIESLRKSLSKSCVLFSKKENKDLETYQVLILDTIGLLSKVYSYADIAYVGGALGNTGLHNTLEPAVFGVPIIIGNNHEKFPEAQEMINNKGMFAISNQNELNKILDLLITDQDLREAYGLNNVNFITKKKGAVIQIMQFLRT